MESHICGMNVCMCMIAMNVDLVTERNFSWYQQKFNDFFSELFFGFSNRHGPFHPWTGSNQNSFSPGLHKKSTVRVNKMMIFYPRNSGTQYQKICGRRSPGSLHQTCLPSSFLLLLLHIIFISCKYYPLI